MSDIIKIAMGELNMAFENEVMKAVQNVGISVNKEELIKALELSDRLVRCKECKWFDQDNTGEWYCTYSEGLTNPPEDGNGFCSYGERRASNGRQP